MRGSRRRVGGSFPGIPRCWCNPNRAAPARRAVPVRLRPKDGTLLGLFAETIAHTQLVQPEIGKWKVQDLAYLGSFANVNAVFMVRKDSPAKTIDEMRHIETKVGCSSRLSQGYQNPSVLKAYGGCKFRIVCGYPCSMEFPMVLARGEVVVISSAWNAWRLRSDVADGTLRPVIKPAS